MNKWYNIKFALLLFTTALIFSCSEDITQTDSPKENVRSGVVKVWDLNEPRGLNPYNNSDITGFNIKQCIFQRLLDFHPETLELVPVLAMSRPSIEMDQDSLVKLTFEIRSEAKWDNGQTITAKDVEFSFKVAAAPGVDDEQLKPYLDFISDFIFYQDNPRKFTVVTNKIHMRAETTVGYEIMIIPSHIYDPNSLLSEFSYQQIKSDSSLANNQKVMDFASEFNSPKYSREVGTVAGSGPYILEEWVTDQRVVLKRKDNWWGDEVEIENNPYFEAHPDRIVHEVINDQTGAITALKGEKIDVMRGIKASEFHQDLSQNQDFLKRFNISTPPQFGYSFLGINTKNPKLRDIQTRQALAHLVNYERMLNDILFGYGERIVGPVHPAQIKFYNSNLALYDFNVDKAKQLLKEAGWEDKNNNGIVDKMINGKVTDLKIDLIYNAGNKDREKVALIFQEDAKKAGVAVNLQMLEWGVMQEKLESHNFDMFYNAWLGEPAPEDYSQLWHTSSAINGSNWVGFGNAETDALINKINTTLDDNKRAGLVKQFQAILYKEVPYIFLWSPQNRIAVNKKFENTYVSAYRPGYYVPAFTLAATDTTATK